MTSPGPHAGRTLEALGLAVAPRDSPLSYPGIWPAESGLLDGDLWLPLSRHTFEDRVPVLAVGSNACPAQLRHKMREYEVSSPIPLVRTRVTGLDVGVSAHVSAMGYMSASPFRAPGHTRELFVTWLDRVQLAAMDASEGVTAPAGSFDRLPLPDAGFRVETDSGERVDGVHLYVNRRGVLHDGTGTPRPHPGERAVIGELLAASARLRELFGTTPEEFSERARGDLRLCAAGTRVLAQEGWTTVSGLEKDTEGRWTAAPDDGAPPSPSP
ncbi:hypothetical protein [Streptomyces fructofermentans]|uniref:Uncharacterized protein n=1 Tax=Streptomyces fructofermentans TaxID=152141 RepID=A0A918NAF8_9ACTN|nr:hypothetical protein [Streptomyces fructofermentans]GGX58259.1 hypothetical protein GCM10010515_27250 [Streptomyces fructofermentans]